jgi:Domain of unknown function (DUF1854)
MMRDANSAERNITPFEPSRVEFGLSRDAWGRLRLIDREGRCHEQVNVIPLFPITDPEHWITICDAEGRELVCIEDPEQLAPEARAVLRDELSRREFLPIINRIVRVSGTSEPCEWEVETDRGRTRFVLESEENVRRLEKNKVAITDSHGIRYLVKDVDALDAKSRRVIEWYV